MKFMDPIQTTMGPGLVVGAAGPGRVVATVTVVETVPAREKGKPPVEQRRYPHRVFARCEKHGVWHLDASRCPLCRAAEEQNGAGQ